MRQSRKRRTRQQQHAAQHSRAPRCTQWRPPAGVSRRHQMAPPSTHARGSSKSRSQWWGRRSSPTGKRPHHEPIAQPTASREFLVDKQHGARGKPPRQTKWRSVRPVPVKGKRSLDQPKPVRQARRSIRHTPRAATRTSPSTNNSRPASMSRPSAGQVQPRALESHRQKSDITISSRRSRPTPHIGIMVYTPVDRDNIRAPASPIQKTQPTRTTAVSGANSDEQNAGRRRCSSARECYADTARK